MGSHNGVKNEGKGAVSRRHFAGLMGLAGASGLTTGLVRHRMQSGDQPARAAAMPVHHGHTAMSSLVSDGEMTVEEMDAMHEEGVLAFPAETEGLGNQPLEYEMDGDVKVFRLTCEVTNWEFAVGEYVDAWTYNGVVPGPEIRATEGETVRFEVTNNLPESTAVHWHGLVLPVEQDGVPFITQPPIKPGETFTYEFTLREGNAGAHMYHSHYNAAFQVTNGLLGSFVVEPKDPDSRPAYDKDYTIVLNDGPIGGYSLNGKSFPATQPLTAKQGERLLIRFMNEGLMDHPMHLHGMPMEVFAADGYMLPQPYLCDTINIAPGQRFEVIVEATELGTWLFHCHILSHVESPHGMFGMATALIVEE